METENTHRLLSELRQQDMRNRDLIDQTRATIAESARLAEQSRELLSRHRSGAYNTDPIALAVAVARVA
ncbi:hypothetical protein [Mesorhizobium sp. WSM3860]|uniref:hypothetical protein n=1 Tax=Mesorhizobium sp. WSM3860 TaxID=2029403 RepID=UPI001140C498|nr:hypothetical protein [Mesorhizobium sp. WSM3860]